jgi:hypothetical protein
MVFSWAVTGLLLEKTICLLVFTLCRPGRGQRQDPVGGEQKQGDWNRMATSSGD